MPQYLCDSHLDCETLTPYIFVEGESSIPAGITLFAATGGRWNAIAPPDEVVDVSMAEQMPAFAALMRVYVERFGGHCPFFGRVRGFRLVRREDSLRFSTDAEFVERIKTQAIRRRDERYYSSRTPRKEVEAA